MPFRSKNSQIVQGKPLMKPPNAFTKKARGSQNCMLIAQCSFELQARWGNAVCSDKMIYGRIAHYLR